MDRLVLAPVDSSSLLTWTLFVPAVGPVSLTRR